MNEFIERNDAKEYIKKQLVDFFVRYGIDVNEGFVDDMSEALLEDVEMDKYYKAIWDKNVINGENEMISRWKDETGIGFLNQKKGYIIEELGYPSRYSVNLKKFEENFNNDVNWLSSYIDEEFYKKCYPIFWLEILNKRHVKNNENFNDLFEPIINRRDIEKYMFSLLLESRKSDSGQLVLFSAIRRKRKQKITKINQEINDEVNKKIKYWCHEIKDEIENLDIDLYEEALVISEKIKKKLLNLCKDTNFEIKNLDDIENRIWFVQKYYELLTEEKKSGNRNKEMFETTKIVLKTLIECGEEEKMDIPLYMYLLDRMTGWIGLCNYSRIKKEWYGSQKDMGIAWGFFLDKHMNKTFSNFMESILYSDLEEIMYQMEKVLIDGIKYEIISENMEFYEDLYNNIFVSEENRYEITQYQVLEYYLKMFADFHE